MPPGSPGFDYRIMAHVEAQAAALMRQQGISEASLYINNPEICERCTRLLERLLPSERDFEGNSSGRYGKNLQRD